MGVVVTLSTRHCPSTTIPSPLPLHLLLPDLPQRLDVTARGSAGLQGAVGLLVVPLATLMKYVFSAGVIALLPHAAVSVRLGAPR